jgi:hypothetical protein
MWLTVLCCGTVTDISSKLYCTDSTQPFEATGFIRLEGDGVELKGDLPTIHRGNVGCELQGSEFD